MIPHPLVLVVGGVDLVVLGLALGAAPVALRLAVDWDPRRTDARQLRLEGHAEAGAQALRWAAGFAMLAGILLVAGIGLWLPGVVPGAMCGTGVMQASGALGLRALTLRLVGVLALYVWQTADALNQQLPEDGLTALCGRLHLVALPALVLGAFETQRALAALHGMAPVDCCVVLYDQAAAARPGARAISDGLWLAAFGFLSLMLPALAARGAWAPRGASGALARVVAVTAVGWSLAAYQALTGVLAAYHYEVLQHRCPWCLLLPVHGGIGFPLYACLLAVVLEAAAGLTALTAAPRGPDLAPYAQARFRKACRRMAAAALLFLLLAGYPALRWRLRHGLWL
jgi:hypothetical protein